MNEYVINIIFRNRIFIIISCKRCRLPRGGWIEHIYPNPNSICTDDNHF